eukprot:7613303-Pyramimonas_sp.AAC.1
MSLSAKETELAMGLPGGKHGLRPLGFASDVLGSRVDFAHNASVHWQDKRRWDDDIWEHINQQNICISWQRCATQPNLWSALEE